MTEIWLRARAPAQPHESKTACYVPARKNWNEFYLPRTKLTITLHCDLLEHGKWSPKIVHSLHHNEQFTNYRNRPFPVALSLCVKTSLHASETIHWEMCSAYRLIFMQIKLIFIWKVLHEDSFWNRGTRWLGNGRSIWCCHSLACLLHCD